jgi:uncharacterized protein
MPEYLAPGVYIEEQTGPEPIEGVSTSVTGFVGVTQRGPVDTLGPVLVTSFPDYERTFGGYFVPDFPVAPYNFYNLLPHAVAGFFNNGGKLLYIKRVYSLTTKPAAAVAGDLENDVGGPLIKTRLFRTALGGDTDLELASTRGINHNSTLVLTQVKNGVTTTSVTLNVTAVDDRAAKVTLSAALVIPASAKNFDAQFTMVTVTTNSGFTPAATAGKFGLLAGDPGSWANNVPFADPPKGVQVQVSPTSRAQAQITTVLTPSQLLLNSAANFYEGAILEINANGTRIYAKVLHVVGSTTELVTALSAPDVTAINAVLPNPVWVRTCEFNLSASYGSVVENFRGLTLDKNTPYFYATTLLNQSSLLSVPQSPIPSDEVTEDPSTMPMAVDGLHLTMTGGTDGAKPVPADYVGGDSGPGNRTGIAALIDAAEISIIAAPGVTDVDTQMALITQCENLKYRFAILDPAPSGSFGTPSLNEIRNQRDLYDTKYAAIYYPRPLVTDPLTGDPLAVPPSGVMAGIYAETDNARGVWKAPANVVLNSVDDLEVVLSKGDQDFLNPEPRNINALRDFRGQGRGLRVYGARCITTDQAWKYINVRRLFIFIEASLDQGTQWAVFEPNDARLWKRLIQSVSNFLTTIWREGGLMGSKPEEAFFVKCGFETMSQDDIENGRLIMLVGVAPVYPAEFVIIRIGQWAGGSSVQEL